MAGVGEGTAAGVAGAVGEDAGASVDIRKVQFWLWAKSGVRCEHL